MPDLRIKRKQLNVDMNPLEKLVAFRRRLRVPLENIQEIHEVYVPFSGIYPAVRQAGTQIPGLIRAGAYLKDGERLFWHVRRGQSAVEIVLQDADFDRLIIGVPDADSTASRLKQDVHVTAH